MAIRNEGSNSRPQRKIKYNYVSNDSSRNTYFCPNSISKDCVPYLTLSFNNESKRKVHAKIAFKRTNNISSKSIGLNMDIKWPSKQYMLLRTGKKIFKKAL
jgi:hypothetical protein